MVLLNYLLFFEAKDFSSKFEFHLVLTQRLRHLVLEMTARLVD